MYQTFHCKTFLVPTLYVTLKYEECFSFFVKWFINVRLIEWFVVHHAFVILAFPLAFVLFGWVATVTCKLQYGIYYLIGLCM